MAACRDRVPAPMQIRGGQGYRRSVRRRRMPRRRTAVGPCRPRAPASADMRVDGVWFTDQGVDGISVTVRPQVIFDRRMASVRLRWDLSGQRWFGPRQMKAHLPEPSCCLRPVGWGAALPQLGAPALTAGGRRHGRVVTAAPSIELAARGRRRPVREKSLEAALLTRSHTQLYCNTPGVNFL